MSVARLSLVLALLFGGFAAAMLLRGADEVWSAASLGFTAWVIAPYALLAAAAGFGRPPAAKAGALALLFFAGGYGSMAYAEITFHFWSKPDAQDALAFAVVPFMQLLVGLPALALLFGLAAWLERRKAPRN